MKIPHSECVLHAGQDKSFFYISQSVMYFSRLYPSMWWVVGKRFR